MHEKSEQRLLTEGERTIFEAIDAIDPVAAKRKQREIDTPHLNRALEATEEARELARRHQILIEHGWTDEDGYLEARERLVKRQTFTYEFCDARGHKKLW